MVAQAGRDLLIKIEMSGSDEFKTLGGLRVSKLSFNAQSVNITNLASSGHWRELLEGAGIRSATINGSGVFVDDESDLQVQKAFFAAEHLRLKMILPDFGEITGEFQINSLEYAGNYDGEMTYDASFASAGALAFDAL